MLTDKTEEAFQTMSRSKVKKLDGITAEFIMSPNGKLWGKFAEILKSIYKNEMRPNYMLKSIPVSVPIEKKKMLLVKYRMLLNPQVYISRFRSCAANFEKSITKKAEEVLLPYNGTCY